MNLDRSPFLALERRVFRTGEAILLDDRTVERIHISQLL